MNNPAYEPQAPGLPPRPPTDQTTRTISLWVPIGTTYHDNRNLQCMVLVTKHQCVSSGRLYDEWRLAAPCSVYNCQGGTR